VLKLIEEVPSFSPFGIFDKLPLQLILLATQALELNAVINIYEKLGKDMEVVMPLLRNAIDTQQQTRIEPTQNSAENQRNAELQNQASQNAVLETNNGMTKLANSIYNLRGDVSILSKNLAKNASDAAKLIKQNEILNATKKSIEDAIAAKNDALNKLNDKIADLNVKLTSAENARKALEAELKALKDTLPLIENQFKQGLIDQATQAQKISELNKEIFDTGTKLNVIDHSIANAMSARDTLMAMKAEVAPRILEIISGKISGSDSDVSISFSDYSRAAEMFNSIDSYLNGVNTKMEGIAKIVSDLGTKKTEIQANIDANLAVDLQTANTNLSNEYNTLSENLQTLSNSIEQNAVNIAFQSDINTLIADLNSIIGKSSTNLGEISMLNGLKQQLEIMKTDIDAQIIHNKTLINQLAIRLDPTSPENLAKNDASIDMTNAETASGIADTNLSNANSDLDSSKQGVSDRLTDTASILQRMQDRIATLKSILENGNRMNLKAAREDAAGTRKTQGRGT
jgi:chromosome segregation ATPase